MALGVGSASLRKQLSLSDRAVRVSADGSAESDLHKAQPAVNPSEASGASSSVVALPGQWLGRLTQPDKLDLSVDRGASFRAWKTRWTDFCTLSGLASQPTDVQMAMLRSCLSDDTIRVVETWD